MINLPRSTYYYRSGETKKQIDDLALIALIDDIHDVFPDYTQHVAKVMRPRFCESIDSEIGEFNLS
ncbi:hypothetical protein SAMN04515618_11856 [Collimonas sp. OK307]|nr:hypothetical protein SAMN04515618_11856 [Collimonas sp. OK307]